MAGTRDTPEERAKRDEVTGKDEPEVEVIEPQSGLPVAYGRRPVAGEPATAMVASAARIDLRDKRSVENTRKRRQSWQSEAWDYYDEIGELGYTVDYGGNLLSKVRLFAAVRPDPGAPPIAVDDEASGVDPATAKLAMETLERLQSTQGGQSALLREITINFDVAGEAFLHGHEDPDTGEEDWQIRSVDELIVTGDQFVLRSAPGTNSGEAISKDDVVVRLWARHARFSNMAVSPMRRVLGEAESLLLLSREIRATAKSRLSNGILLVPSELSFGSVDPTRDNSSGEVTDDPFDESLQDSMITPIQAEGSASSIVPLVLRGPAETLNAVRHVKLERPIDASLDGRIEGRIMRLARALNMPVEVLTGLQETTFANASQVKKSEWDSHGEPRAVLICDALTAGYFQPALEESGIPRERVRDFFIWADPSDAIAAPDPVDNAVEAHRDGLISDEARRRVTGFSEGDAPTNDEILRRIILQSVRLDPFVLAQLLVLTGIAPDIEIPAPQGGTVDAPSTAGEIPMVAASRRPRLRAQGLELGRKLTQIDKDLRTRLVTASDAALKRVLERAGNKIKTKVQRDKGGMTAAARAISTVSNPRLIAVTLGPSLVAAAGLTDQELIEHAFDDLGNDFLRWTRQAQESALRVLNVKLSPTATLELTQKFKKNRETAWANLETQLVALAAKRLYEPNPALVAAGEYDASIDIPISMIRESMGIAGGAEIVNLDGAIQTVDGVPAQGVATGPDIVSFTDGVEGYQWVHGAPAHPLDSHESLDGELFENWDDDVLSNSDDFPDTDFVYPGDHDGCFVAGTVVSGPVPRGSTLRRYEGSLVELSFASGQKLTATPNHPILTDEGWIAAGLLHEGSHVVRCVDADGIAGLIPDDYQRPALIEEVVGTVGESLSVLPATVKVAPEHFHGDGSGSKVAVVRTDGELRNGLHTSVSQPASQQNLIGSGPDPSLLSSDGSGTELLEGVGSSSLSFKGVRGNSPSTFRSASGIDDEKLVTDRTHRNISLDESFSDRYAIDAETLGQTIDGISSFIELDKVIDLSRREFTGDVYNLQTATGWYVANDVIVHNCTCDAIPVLIPDEGAVVTDEGIPSDMSTQPLDDAEISDRMTELQSEMETAQAQGMSTEDQFDKLPTTEKWTEDRLDLHRQIIDDMLAQAKDVPRDHEAVISGGLPGAGKSTGLADYVGLDPSKYFTIDPDAIKAELMERGAAPVLPGYSPMESATLVHEESSVIAKRLGDELQQQGTNVVWDITMNSEKSVQSRLDNLTSQGYQNIKMYFFDIPPELSVERVEQRYARGVNSFVEGNGLGGRYIDPNYLASLKDPQYGSVNLRTFEAVKSQASDWALYDNTGATPRLVSQSG